MAQALTRERLMTAEEFHDRYAGKEGRAELVYGKVVEMSPAGPTHGEVDANLVGILGPYVRSQRLGKVYLNTGFILQRNPDLVRGPDEAFVSSERLAAMPPPERGFYEIVPDLAVEIFSPEDTVREMNAKVREYLGFGVRLIWVIYPRRREVHVHRPNAAVRVLVGDAVLDGEDVLLGFRTELAALWG